MLLLSTNVHNCIWLVLLRVAFVVLVILVIGMAACASLLIRLVCSVWLKEVPKPVSIGNRVETPAYGLFFIPEVKTPAYGLFAYHPYHRYDHFF
jgi:hypothetical protein